MLTSTVRGLSAVTRTRRNIWQASRHPGDLNARNDLACNPGRDPEEPWGKPGKPDVRWVLVQPRALINWIAEGGGVMVTPGWSSRVSSSFLHRLVTVPSNNHIAAFHSSPSSGRWQVGSFGLLKLCNYSSATRFNVSPYCLSLMHSKSSAAATNTG